MPVQRLPRGRRRPHRAESRRGWSARAVTVVVNGFVVSVTGVYIATRSTTVTLTSAFLAVILVGWLALLDR